MLHSHEECLRNKRAQAENFRHIEEQSNMMHAQRLLQEVGGTKVVVNPPYPPMTTAELDASFDLPYTRQPHPKYKGKRIPAYEMIKLVQRQHPSRLFRRLCLLHHLRPSGQVHHLPLEGEHPPRGEAGHPDA